MLENREGQRVPQASFRTRTESGEWQTLTTDDLWLCLENTAGAGGTIGRSVNELEALFAAVDRHPRLGLCLDSCHWWASGVDVTDRGALQAALDDLDGRIGLERLRLLHVNDSKAPLGANRDRHELDTLLAAKWPAARARLRHELDAIVVAQIGLGLGAISDAAYGVVLCMAVLTMLIAPPFLVGLFRGEVRTYAEVYLPTTDIS